jgi:hypothetical protein
MILFIHGWNMFLSSQFPCILQISALNSHRGKMCGAKLGGSQCVNISYMLLVLPTTHKTVKTVLAPFGNTKTYYKSFVLSLALCTKAAHMYRGQDLGHLLLVCSGYWVVNGKH